MSMGESLFYRLRQYLQSCSGATVVETKVEVYFINVMMHIPALSLSLALTRLLG